MTWGDSYSNGQQAIFLLYSSRVGAIRKLKSCVDQNTLICAYNALILPHFDYCCEVWETIGVTFSDRLQKLQNRAARVITGRKNEHGQSELALNLNELNFKTAKNVELNL